MKANAGWLLGLALVGLAACGGEHAASGNGMSAATPREVRFTAKDFSFEGPDTIEAGMVTWVLENESPTWHLLQLIRLPEGMTVAAFTQELTSAKPGSLPADWMVYAGGVNPPAPGEAARVTMRVDPGRYVVLCPVDVPDHVPHFVKGMVKGLTVTPSAADAAPAPLPPSDMSLTLVDYAFSFAAPPTAGSHVIHVENDGTQAHEFGLFKLLPGKTVDDAMAWSETYEGPPPMTTQGGVPPIPPGVAADVYVDLTPGRYLALCFTPDAKDGRPHVAHGMMLPFQVS